MAPLSGFSDFCRRVDERSHYIATVHRDYGVKPKVWDEMPVPIGCKVTIHSGHRTIILLPGTEVEKCGESANGEMVKIKIHNKPDPRDPELSDTAHGKPSLYHGQTFWIPKTKWEVAIQVPNSGQGAAAGGGK